MTRLLSASLLCGSFVVACESFGASAETAGPDGGGVPDSGTADAIAAETSAGFVCPKNALWCETFDQSFAEWTGASAPVHTIGTAPGHGNIAITNAPAGAGRHTFWRVVPGPGKDVRVELSFRLAAPSPDLSLIGSSNVAVAGVDVPNVAALGLFIDRKVGTPAGKFYVAATASVGGSFNFTEGQELTYGDWHRAFIEVRFGTAQSYGFGVDGTSDTQALPKTVDEIPSPLFLGAWRPNDATPALVVDFDDIVVTSL